MTGLEITHIGVYTEAEKHRQKIYVPWISFYVSGVKRVRTYLPNGQLINELDEHSESCFRLGLPGMEVDFEVTENRENWVIMMNNLEMRYSDDYSQAYIKDQNSWIPVPYFVDVPKEQVQMWRMHLRQIQTSCQNPTPGNSLKARLGVMNIFRYILEQESDVYVDTPAEKLKALLDDNSNFAKNIMELSDECGYSPDHLRILFEKQYQIKPLAYRNLRRKAYVMELIAKSDYSVEEIAKRAGFKYCSHFSLDFKKEYGISPSEAIKKYRYRH